MLNKKKDKYIITHASEINEHLEIIRAFYLERIRLDKILKKVNYEAYEKIEKMINSIKDIAEVYDLHSLLLTQRALGEMMHAIETIPRKIYQLEIEGYSISSFTAHEKIIMINKIMENIYQIRYFIPKIEEYLICAPEIKKALGSSNKLQKFIIEHRLYDMIVLFRLEDIARPLRQTIAITPLRNKNSIIGYMLQRYGLTPMSGFIYQNKNIGSADIVISLTEYDAPYFDSYNIYKSKSAILGLSQSILDTELMPHTPQKQNTVKSNIPSSTHSGKIKIFETIDGVKYRQLKCANPQDIMRGPSAIANGYNEQFNEKIEKYIGAPIINSHISDVIKNRGKNQYADIKTELHGATKANVVKKFISYMMSQLDFDRTDKFLIHELKILLVSEKIKLKRKLKLASSLEDFFKDIIADRDNFILNFDRKIKIYNKWKY